MIITTWDFILLLFQLPGSILLIWLLSKTVNPELRRHFRLGLFLKLAACIILGLVYQYYYGFGDTLNYFSHSKVVTNAMLHSPGQASKYLFSSVDEFGTYFRSYIDQLTEADYYFSTPNITMVKIAAVCNFLSFNSFFGTGFIFCFFSYIGLWRLFLVFYRAYPDIGPKFALILYIPSVVFWGSGILKDSFCMGAIGLVIYMTDTLFSDKKAILRLIVIIICFYMIWLIKPYIVVCLILPLLIWKYSLIVSKLREAIPLRISLSVTALFMLLVYRFMHIGARLQDISLPEIYLKIITTRRGFESSADSDGSSFSLGEFTPTVWGFIKQIPKAINAVLFRPYVWETKKIFSLIASAESLVILVVTLYIIFKAGMLRSVKNFFVNPDIFFCFFFTMLFAAALGITVSNFGALVRFKIQFLPFFGIGLLLIYYRKEKRSIENLS